MSVTAATVASWISHTTSDVRHEVQRTAVSITISGAGTTVRDLHRLVLHSAQISRKRHHFSSPRKSGTFRAPSISSESEEDEDDNPASGNSSDNSEPEVLPLSACAQLPQLTLCTIADPTVTPAPHRGRTRAPRKQTTSRTP